MSKRLKLLIFDLDGTLVDSSIPMGRAFNHTLKQMGLEEYNQKETDALIGTPLSKLFMRIMNRPTRDAMIEQCIKIYRQKYLEIFLDRTFLYDGVADVIPKLAGRYTISLATTKKTDVATMTLEHFGLKDHFELLLGFDTVKEPKPSPEIINRTLELLHFKPDEAMMVGDSLYDLKASKAAGVTSCMVTYGFENIKNLIENKPDIVIDKFQELLKLLEDRTTG